MDYAGKIKDKEFKLTFDENLSQKDKDLIGKEIIDLGEEEKEMEVSYDEKYKEKIKDLKEELKNMNIHNLEWVKKLKEKYSKLN